MFIKKSQRLLVVAVVVVGGSLWEANTVVPTKMLARNRSRPKKDRLLVRSSGNNTLLEHSPRSAYRPEKAAPNPVRSVYFFKSVKNSLLGSDSIRF